LQCLAAHVQLFANSNSMNLRVPVLQCGVGDGIICPTSRKLQSGNANPAPTSQTSTYAQAVPDKGIKKVETEVEGEKKMLVEEKRELDSILSGIAASRDQWRSFYRGAGKSMSGIP
jgi:hypothetical protein